MAIGPGHPVVQKSYNISSSFNNCFTRITFEEHVSKFIM